jgi:peptidoglycan/xylan/chitin deacetylase (PgdA/CDA1 family)
MAAHGIMFHHFHGDGHPPGQGSISADQLDAMIQWLGPGNILPAREWMQRAIHGGLRDGDLCITFDDNLRCQFDVALDVLRARGLTAFWFVYTSVMEGRLERLELYRKFRMTRFSSVDAFYDCFFKFLASGPWSDEAARGLRGFDPRQYLAAFPFYTDGDRQFRFVRDEVLGAERYQDVMDTMIADSGVSLGDLVAGLWMDDKCVRQLHDQGHVVGLHSHTHPTRLERLDREGQRAEYAANIAYLTNLLGTTPTAMSHPCNSYNATTLEVLRELGVKLGFRANMTPGFSGGPTGDLQHPRQDHANLLAEMQRGDSRLGAAV